MSPQCLETNAWNESQKTKESRIAQTALCAFLISPWGLQAEPGTPRVLAPALCTLITLWRLREEVPISLLQAV